MLTLDEVWAAIVFDQPKLRASANGQEEIGGHYLHKRWIVMAGQDRAADGMSCMDAMRLDPSGERLARKSQRGIRQQIACPFGCNAQGEIFAAFFSFGINGAILRRESKAVCHCIERMCTVGSEGVNALLTFEGESGDRRFRCVMHAIGARGQEAKFDARQL